MPEPATHGLDVDFDDRGEVIGLQPGVLEGAAELVVACGAHCVVEVSLQIDQMPVYELARRGEIPGRRLGRTWRFLRPRLEELLGA